MTLVLQIAAGIILAVVILAFWRQILGLGVLLAVIGVLLAVGGLGLWIGADALMANRQYIGVWFVTVGFFSLIAWGVYRLSQKETRRQHGDSVPPPEQLKQNQHNPEP